MDRLITWPAAIPLETDPLNTNKNTMLALSKIAAAMFGTTAGFVNGLTVAPTGPAGLTVNVGPGEIYSLQNVDNSAYSSLALDTTHQIVKQGVNLNTVNLSCPAPGTAGQSVNYLIEATFTEADTGSTVLPYYNASNPAVAYSGPGGSGTPNYTLRACTVTLFAKAGTAAATGSQTTPAVDSGYVPLAIVVVSNGQTQITSTSILPAPNAPVIGQPLTNGRLLNVQTFTSSGTYTPTPGTTSIIVETLGAGGAGGGAAGTGAGQSALGTGGAGGAYSKGRYTSGIGSVAVTIGAGGAGVAGAAGGNGGATSFGALQVSNGGAGGANGPNTAPFPTALCNVSNATNPTSGNLVNLPGQASYVGVLFAASNGYSSPGGNSFYGGGGDTGNITGVPGNPASGKGAGGSGAMNWASVVAAQAGGAGTPGLVIVHEYA